MAAEKQWDIAPLPPAEALARYGELPLSFRRILYHRGILSLEEFEKLRSPDDDFSDPMHLKGMDQAVERICRAVTAQERIAVYGDFDVDGVTATALLTETLQAVGANVTWHIPHRIEEGYGLLSDSLKRLQEQGVGLVITVDCGMRSCEEATVARQIGLDLIITDHHAPGDCIPECVAIVNPKQAGDTYPFQELAGSGVAFKLAQAILREIPPVADIREESLLELAALGTVADLVPLTGENRSLVKRGLLQLVRSERPGLRAILARSGRQLRIDASAIGRFYGPRLNAAGRLEHARTAFELLMVQDEAAANELAGRLETTNRQRQQLTEELYLVARDQAQAQVAGDPILIVGAEEFPEGIIGLLAGRLQEEYYRPAIAMHLGNGIHRGSARSIPEFSVVGALDECRDLLIGHGGHAGAAGFRVAAENYPALTARLREIARRELDGRERIPRLSIDTEATLNEMSRMLPLLETLAPFGYGNPEPVFVSRDVLVERVQVVGTIHCRLIVRDEKRVIWDCIAFRQAELAHWLRPGQRVDIAYSLRANVFQGNESLQLELKDVKVRA